MAAYDLVLAKMKPVGAASLPAAPQTNSSKRKRKQPEDPSDLSLPIATANTATEEPKGIIKRGKKNKKEKTLSGTAANVLPPAASLDTISPSVSVVPAVGMQDVSATRPQAARARGRHIGRYHKTAAAKKAGSYSQSDLAAILGVDSLPAAAPAAPTVAAVSKPFSSDPQVSLLKHEWVTTMHEMFKYACMHACMYVRCTNPP